MIKKKDKKGKQKIFKAAADVFAKKGYHETTVDEIAQAAGIAKGTLYYHFENKEEFYLAVIKEGVNRLKDELKRAADNSSATTTDKIRSLIKAQLGFYESEKELVLLFIREFCGPDLIRGSHSGKMLSGCLQVIRAVIEEGMERGVFHRVDPEVASYSFFGMVTISALHYMNLSQSIPHDLIEDTIVQIFFNGLCK